jgi:uncharacterized protein (TIGR02265 family)
MEQASEQRLLSRPIEVGAYLRACPSRAATRGTFYQTLVDHAEAELGQVPASMFEGVPQRRWVIFKQYPLRDFIQLVVNVAGAVHASLPLAEGLRRLGWIAYPAFSATLAGKVVLYALGNRLENVLESAPRAYGLVLPESDVRVTLGNRVCRMEMRAVYNFVDTYQFGVLEGTIREHGFRPKLSVKQLANPADADFELRW